MIFKVTVPALLATGAGKVVKKMREKEGEVSFHFYPSVHYPSYILVIMIQQCFDCPDWQAGEHFGEKLEKSGGGILLTKCGGECGWRRGG